MSQVQAESLALEFDRSTWGGRDFSWRVLFLQFKVKLCDDDRLSLVMNTKELIYIYIKTQGNYLAHGRHSWNDLSTGQKHWNQKKKIDKCQMSTNWFNIRRLQQQRMEPQNHTWAASWYQPLWSQFCASHAWINQHELGWIQHGTFSLKQTLWVGTIAWYVGGKI